MRTLKAIKITSFLNSIFCFCCIVFATCLTINQHYSVSIIKTIGVFAAFGWMLNPSPFLLFIASLMSFLGERHSPEARQIIGKKHIWIFIWPVITTLFYFTAMGFLVEITGGV